MSTINTKLQEVLKNPELTKQVFGPKPITEAVMNKIRPGLAVAEKLFVLIEDDRKVQNPEWAAGDETPITKEQIDSLKIEQVEQHPKTEFSALIAAAKHRIKDSDDMGDEQIVQAALDGRWSRKVVLLCVSNRPVNFHVHFSILAQMKKCPWVGYEYEADAIIQRARNKVVHRFLKTEAEVAIFHDDDVVMPFGSPGHFFARLHADQGKFKPRVFEQVAIERLLSHKKTLVGGIYRERQRNGRLVIQPAIHPRNAEDREIARSLNDGPIDKLFEVSWLATGCLLIHRSVFEDIRTNSPDRAPENPDEAFDFFGHNVGVGGQGEDISFCGLAARAGHPAYLDGNLWCAHIGTDAFL